MVTQTQMKTKMKRYMRVIYKKDSRHVAIVYRQEKGQIAMYIKMK